MGETLKKEEFLAYLDEMMSGDYAQKHGFNQEQANDVVIDFISKNIGLMKELKPGRLQQIAGEIQSGRLNTGKNQADQRVMEILEAIQNAEKDTAEKPPAESEQSLSGGELSPELNIRGEIAKIDSAVQEFKHWLEIFNGDLNSGGSTWDQIDRGLTHHLNQLNKLRSSELIAKGKIPEKTEDSLFATVDNVRRLKQRHDRLQPPTQYAQAA